MASELSPAPIDRRAFLGVGATVLGGLGVAGAAEPPLPAGVRAVWDLAKAHREKTETRERVGLNGLWRWQPGTGPADAVAADRWGYFKVPGFWPGNTNYIQEDCQTLFAHPSWKGADMRKITSWAAIIAIPTMVAGIYGMNFEFMPELHWRFGYPAAVLVVVIACSVLYRIFRRNRWL